MPEPSYPIRRTDAEWAELLTPLQFEVLRRAGTEPPGTGEYTDTTTAGTYLCRACEAELFTSDTKFATSCGWPSFYAPTDQEAVEYVEDYSHGMRRVEVRCATCGSHLGHVFTGEGHPTPTDERYCINSVSLRLQPGTHDPANP